MVIFEYISQFTLVAIQQALIVFNSQFFFKIFFFYLFAIRKFLRNADNRCEKTQNKSVPQKRRHILQHSEASRQPGLVVANQHWVLSNFLSSPLRKQMIMKAYPQSLAANFHQTGSVYKSVCSDAFKGTW